MLRSRVGNSATDGPLTSDGGEVDDRPAGSEMLEFCSHTIGNASEIHIDNPLSLFELRHLHGIVLSVVEVH